MSESNCHRNNLYSSSPESLTACLYIHTKLSLWTFKKWVNVEKLFVYVPDIPGKTHPPVRKEYNMLGNATFGFTGQLFHITLPNHICWFIWTHTHSTIIHVNMGQSFYLENTAGHITDKKWKRWCLWFVLICSSPSCFCGSISLPASDHLRFNFIFLTKKMHFKYEHKILLSFKYPKNTHPAFWCISYDMYVCMYDVFPTIISVLFPFENKYFLLSTCWLFKSKHRQY